jgi:hypothetical protein
MMPRYASGLHRLVPGFKNEPRLIREANHLDDRGEGSADRDAVVDIEWAIARQTAGRDNIRPRSQLVGVRQRHRSGS